MLNPEGVELIIEKTSQSLSWPWLTLSLVTLLTGVHLLLDSSGARHWFWLDTERAGELWRIVTAHWVHTDWHHLVWNCIALLVLGGWLESTSRRLLVIGLCMGTLIVSIWFVLFTPTPLYCGLSGVLNSLLMLVVSTETQKARANRDWLALGLFVLVGIGAVIKVVSELSLEVRWVPVGVWPSAPGAHAAGMLGGFFYLFALSGSRSRLFKF